MSLPAAKILLLGDIGVGKSSLARRFVFDRFETEYKTTIGVDILTHDVAFADGETMRLVLWDTDGDFGQQIFRTIYAKGASGAVVVADATRPITLEKAGKLALDFETNFPGRPCAVVVNKIDLIPELERNFNVPGILPGDIAPASAMTGENVQGLFLGLGHTIRRRA